LHLGSVEALGSDVKYSNSEYGYSVRLPVTAPQIRNQAPAPEHGLAIDLPSGGRIWVDGCFDAGFQKSARRALQQILDESGGKLVAPVKAGRLAGLESARASYSKGVVVSTRIVAYRTHRQAIGILYTLGLDTTHSNWTKDEKVFERVVRTFALTGMKQSDRK
jgi:hypothetical protein